MLKAIWNYHPVYGIPIEDDPANGKLVIDD
jgi:hypothetical protein